MAKVKEELFACQNCDWKGTEDAMDELTDVYERVPPGDTMPYGQCPECNCACFPDEADSTKYHTGSGFVVPISIAKRAKTATRAGESISIKPSEIIEMLQTADKALNGDSNDDEHDALYALREELSNIYETPERWVGKKKK